MVSFHRVSASPAMVRPRARVCLIPLTDCVIGKTTPKIRSDDGERIQFPKQDTSIGHRPGEVGIVDAVLITTDERGRKYVKLRTHSVRVPQVGDKVNDPPAAPLTTPSSRHRMRRPGRVA